MRPSAGIATVSMLALRLLPELGTVGDHATEFLSPTIEMLMETYTRAALEREQGE